MFPDVNNLLDITPDAPPEQQVISVSSSGTDHSFIIHHFLSLYIKSGCNVCMLAMEQSFGHFNNVAMKISVNLNKAKTEGKLIFIEGLKLCGGVLLNPEEDDSVLEIASSDPLKKLYGLIESSVDKLCSDNPNVPTMVLIDDLSVFVNIGIHPVKVLDMFHYLRVLVTERSNLSLVVGSHWDRDIDVDEENELLYRALQHQSDVTVDVCSLPSGYCKDVHGQIKVITKRKSQSPVIKNMHFKILDKTVTLFPVGYSSAVL